MLLSLICLFHANIHKFISRIVQCSAWGERKGGKALGKGVAIKTPFNNVHLLSSSADLPLSCLLYSRLIS